MKYQKLTLPKQYLSHTQIDLFRKDKDAYRRRYYLGEKLPETPEMLFGKEVAKLLENPLNLPDIPRLPEPEKEIKTEIKGVPVMAYLDSFDPKTNTFIEFKTSHAKPDGSLPWDAPRVRNLFQLPLYSLLIKNAFGSVNPKTELIWLETEFAQAEEEFNGLVLTGESRTLRLTGRWESFPRRIAEWERKRAAKIIRETAEEIAKDWQFYRNKLKND